MASKTKINIKEDLSDLKRLLKSERDTLIANRIRCLIFLKEEKFKKRKDLADHLCISYASLKRWLKMYRETGLEFFLCIKQSTGRKNSIPEEIHNALFEKLHESTSSFISYKEAVLWIQDNYNVQVKYETLRTYMIRNFKSKLKSPRKSHYKKDEQAVKVFKKTS